jgi:hypothetical protein
MHKPESTNKGFIVGYEHSDVKLAPLVLAFGGLVGLFVASSAAMMWFLNFTQPKYASDASVPGWSVERKLPAHPQLQANPKEEMNLFKEAEAPYGKRIESAIDVVAKQGISGVTENEPASGFKSEYPGSRSSKAGVSGHGSDEHTSGDSEGHQGH